MKLKPKFQLNDLVRVADSMKMFSKGNLTNWSYELNKILEMLKIQHQVIALTFYQSVMMKPYCKKQS